MGDPITCAVTQLIVNDLAKQVNMHAQYAMQFKSQFQEMENELNLMRSYLIEANKQKGKNKSVKSTLSNLQELIYEADNVIIDCQIREDYLKAKGNSWCLCPSPREISFRYNTGKKLTELNKEIVRMHKNLRTFVGPITEQCRSDDSSSSKQKRWSAHIFRQSEIVGLSEDTRKIKEWILPHSESLHRVAIVGMGGLGKTTIAQKIYHDTQVNMRFQKKVWVSVSQTYDELLIMKGILRQLNEEDSGTDKGDLLNRILEALSDKSYLIVMDDVWSIADGWWDRISRGLPIDHNSCIIITSRDEDVVKRMGATKSRIHLPRLLDQDESWSLFCKSAHLTNKEERNAQLKKVGKEIVGKCRGLPLAIKTTGGMLSSKPHSVGEWTRICENFREKLVLDSESIIRKLDKLSPPKRVEELYLRHFLGETTPAWVNPISLLQLMYLCIEDSRMLSSMSENFWKGNEDNWNVEGLCFKFLPRLDETWEKIRNAIPTLKYLEVSHCNSLKRFPCNVEGLDYWTKTEEDEDEQGVISCHEESSEGEFDDMQ